MSYHLKLEATPRHQAMTLCGQMNYQACCEEMEVLAVEIAEHRGLQVQGFRCPDQARARLAG